MKKILLIGLSILSIVILGVGCVPAQTAPAAQAQTSPLQELQNWQKNIDTWKTTIADPAIAKINAQVQATAVDYQSQINALKATETQTQNDAVALNKRVTDLENWQKTIGAVPQQQQQIQPGQSGVTTQFIQGTTPGVIATSPNGAVVSQVNVVSGNLQIASSTSASSQPIWYIQRLINYNSAIMYVKPTLNIAQSTQYGWNNVPVSVNSTTIAINSVQCTMTVSGSSNGATVVSIIGNSNTANANAPATDQFQMSVSPGLGYLTTSVSYQPVKGCGTPSGDFYLSPGGYMDVTVQISNFTTSQSAFWTVTPSLSYHP